MQGTPGLRRRDGRNYDLCVAQETKDIKNMLSTFLNEVSETIDHVFGESKISNWSMLVCSMNRIRSGQDDFLN